MKHLSGQVIRRDQDEAALDAAHLPDHSRAEPGCLSFSVTRTADPLIRQVEESLVPEAAFEAHQVRTRAGPWFAATAHIRRDYRTEGE